MTFITERPKVKLWVATILISLFIQLSASAQALFSVTATVKNEKGEALPFVSVFLSGSERSTQTDDNGYFKLNNLLPGNYKLVAGIIGYAKFHQNITITNLDIKLEIKLSPTAVALKEVVIGVDPNRAKHLEAFKRVFIGQSANARKCTLTNPEKLSLFYNKKTQILRASSDEFLILENNALGYRVKFLLNEFELDLKTSSYHYKGTTLFEELTGSEKKLAKWQEERQKAYKGSRMHFLRSAFSNNITNNGFVLYNAPEDNAAASLKEVSASALFKPVNGDFISAQFSQPLIAVYKEEKTPLAFTETGQQLKMPLGFENRKAQVSKISMLCDYVIIDKNGSYIADEKHNPNESLEFSGYWAWENVADLLPIEYADKELIVVEPDSSVAPQVVSHDIQKLVNAATEQATDASQEKLFLHFDKPYYTTGDTIWYKAYLLNTHLEASDKSGLMYLELANEKDSAVYRRMVPLVDGLTYGNLHLDGYPEGNYTLRAYTNWMRNFSENYIFKKQFYISSINPKKWLVKYKADLSKMSENNLRLSLGFNTLSNQPVGLRELQLRVLAGKKELVKSKVQTSVDGLLDVNFNIPEGKGKSISVIAKDLRKGEGEQVFTIPIAVNRMENTDVQFMPEGGNLVSGIESTVGFKAINEDGKGVNIEGTVYDSGNQSIASFKSTYNGIGIFKLLPKAGEVYFAKVILPGGITKSYTLPKVLSTGTTLQVQTLADSLRIKIQFSSGIDSLNRLFYLVGQSRELVCYAAKTYLNRNDHILTISKNLFPSGVAHIVLLNQLYQPLNERLIYIKGTDQLAINLSTNKQSYSARDNIALQLNVQDLKGEPVSGNFSLAITDDEYVKPDSLYASSIVSSMLLTSELKGDVEYPGYYLQEKKHQELDALLLTQGWIAYNWDGLFKPKTKPAYDAEKELVVKGHVLNVFNKPLANVSVSLASSWPPIKKEVRTNSVGTFVFKDFPALDSAMFHLKSLNKNDKSYNVGIKVDEFVPPAFKKEQQIIPWYVNIDTSVLKKSHSVISQREAYEKFTGTKLLKEVIIKGKKTIQGSKNLYGSGNADFVLDAADMLKAEKLNLLQLLELRMPRFRNTGYSPFGIHNRTLILIIDGMESGLSGMTLKEIFQYFTAEDIKGIELIASKNMEYFRKFIFPISPFAISSDYAFIEITTISGLGPLFKATPGTYFYRPMPFAWPKKFYSPKYTAKSNPLIPDLRSTIHWEPNVITDASGKQVVSFHAADKPGSYTVTLQGADMEGKVGFVTKKIIISDVPKQENVSEPGDVNTLINAVKNREEAFTPEKLFLHFDKPHYTTGDTIWYKAYLLNSHLEASDKSGLMYVEIINENDSVMYRSMVPLVNGLTHGNLDLTKYPEGNYTLQAYTNWMRNFSENYIFKKQFYIASINPKQWLVNYKAALSNIPENNLRLSLGLKTLNNQPIGLRELQLKVLAGKKELKKSNVQTSADGLLDVDLKIPETREGISVTAKDLRKADGEQMVTIPIAINRIENTDVQFMPEGGKLIAGIESKIGFKAIDGAGKGIDIEGKVYDAENRAVASFKSLHAGMGTFNLLPLANQTYTAKVKLQTSIIKSYTLPVVSKSGTAIKVLNTIDTLKVTINALGNSASSYYLIGQSRGLICYAARFFLKEGQRNFKLPKNLFPAGITHVVLLNAEYQPLTERLVFIKGTDELMVDITTNQQSYAIKDSIALTVTAQDYEQRPISGSFSLAVTDDSLVKSDSLFSANIMTNMLLTSDLNGEVEYPAYYLQNGKHHELDALLLTQGWVAYKWEDVFKPIPPPEFATEEEFQVKGRVINAFNKPVNDASISVTSNWPPILKQTQTNSDGDFVFKGFPAIDTAMLHLKALNKDGKSFNVGVEVDEFIPPVFVQRQPPVIPWYVNADSTFLNTTKAIIKQRTDAKVDGKNVLQEVVIKVKKVVKGSKNLNGAGVADQILDEDDLNKANKMSLLEVLQKNIKGFRVGVSRGFGQDYMVYEKVAHLVFDGVRIDDSYYPAGSALTEHYQFTKTFMDYYTAEDIKGIEVMYNVNKTYATKINSDDYTFNKDIQGKTKPVYGADNSAHAYIEITTRTGRGPNVKVTPGTYVYKPMPFAWPKEFYRPRYAANKSFTESDLRSTIHWEPNVVTDATGKKVISFYAALKPGSYTLTLQGADMGGKLGFITQKIVIK